MLRVCRGRLKIGQAEDGWKKEPDRATMSVKVLDLQSFLVSHTDLSALILTYWVPNVSGWGKEASPSTYLSKPSFQSEPYHTSASFGSIHVPPTPESQKHCFSYPGLVSLQFVLSLLFCTSAQLFSSRLAINVIYSFVGLMALGETETQQQQQNEKCWLHDKGFFFSDARSWDLRRSFRWQMQSPGRTLPQSWEGVVPENELWPRSLQSNKIECQCFHLRSPLFD